MNILSGLKKTKVGRIYENIDLSSHTTYKIKGKGKYLVVPNDIDDLLRLMKYIKENQLKYKVIGGGSNLIFKDTIYDGILVSLEKFDEISFKDTMIHVGCGVSLMKVALKASRMGLTGMEFATGIPIRIGILT